MCLKQLANQERKNKDIRVARAWVRQERELNLILLWSRKGSSDFTSEVQNAKKIMYSSKPNVIPLKKDFNMIPDSIWIGLMATTMASKQMIIADTKVGDHGDKMMMMPIVMILKRMTRIWSPFESSRWLSRNRESELASANLCLDNLQIPNSDSSWRWWCCQLWSPSWYHWRPIITDDRCTNCDDDDKDEASANIGLTTS